MKLPQPVLISQIHILGNTHMITKDSFEWVLTNDGKMFL